jgi:Kef-type K+ transport system membrane component KefB
MIRVGYEFTLKKSRFKEYTWDFVVSATAATFPWLFCTLYFLLFLLPTADALTPEAWKGALLAGLFASPTSAGILFAMLGAAGLSATWVFKKARILAIFDDIGTVLLIIPLQLLFIGLKWQLGIVLAVTALLLWIAWHFMHVLKIPIAWPWVFVYAIILVACCESVYILSHQFDPQAPIHLEVLLPAFVLGCVVAKNGAETFTAADTPDHHEPEILKTPTEKRVATLVGAVFMLLIGFSMPSFVGVTNGNGVAWGTVALHVIAITMLSNAGKLFPAFCYRNKASWRERLAVAIAMFPRGEVGAGVLLIALSYSVSQTILVVAILSLIVNLVLTGVFIAAVKRLVRPDTAPLQGKQPCLALNQCCFSKKGSEP